MTAMFPRFEQRAPWWGGDLQTLRNFLVPRRADLTGYPLSRILLPMADGSGDRLVAYLNRSRAAVRRPLVLLIHGLTGCSESSYMRASARHFLRLGHPVLRLNLRGAGPSRRYCRLQYHAGRSQDLRDLLLELAGADEEAASHGETWEEHALANVACKAAIKAGQTLSPEEQRELIRQLEQADAHQSCCHGRPTMVHLSLAALEREFDRR